MMNLVLGATEPGAVEGGHLGAASEWARLARRQPLRPGDARHCRRPTAAERWLRAHGFGPGYAWMKFVRDAHPPRFRAPGDVEVVELDGPATRSRSG